MAEKPGGPAYGAMDIGAGSGSKIGLFGPGLSLLGETLVPVGEYGGRPESMADRLAGALTGLLKHKNLSRDALRAVGVSCPGLFRSDGSAIVVANLRFLWDANLPELLRERLDVPVRMANDADAGGLAEWSLAREELLYWVFGGGWGGAWVSAEGGVRHSSLDWDGDDASLHYSNEPGYAIPLAKAALRDLFAREGASFAHFEELCVEELKPEGGELAGPCGRTDCVRAELLLSGPGRWRIFRALAESDITSTEHLSPREARKLADSATAGEVITKLHRLGVDVAVRADRLFGLVLGEAADILFQQARRDGCPVDSTASSGRRGPGAIPIYVAGGPSRALPLFGPPAQEAMRAAGIESELRLSRMERGGQNANLIGAAVLAESIGEAA